MSRHAKLRKKLYVSGAIQGRILLRVTAYWLLYHAVLWHALFLSSGLTIDGNYISLTDAYVQFFWQHRILLLCAAAVFPIIFRDMLKMTHRVAGPFVRFERTLCEMTQGRHVEPITLRKNDLVHEFVGVFNEFIEHYNQELAHRADQDVEQAGTPQSDEADQPELAAAQA